MSTSETTVSLPHIPVLPAESLHWLSAGPGKLIIDGTFGAGGHSRLLLEHGAHVLAVDQDPSARAAAQALEKEFGSDRFRFEPGNFRDLSSIVTSAAKKGSPVSGAAVMGLLLDLGVSSMQLDEGERGFAFRHDGPLDMRMSDSGPSAADVVAETDVDDLAALIYRYGEERNSRRIARAIVSERQVEPISTTARLAEVIKQATPGGSRRDHPARRTFQALRLFVNDELGALEQVLKDAADVLSPGGRIVVLSYHSLEDRIVKHALRQDARFEVLTRRPISATEQETTDNPRARSAKLRAAERVSL